MRRVEGVRAFPFTLIMQDRSQERKHNRVLKAKQEPIYRLHLFFYAVKCKLTENNTDFFDKVSLEGDIPAGFVWNGHGNDARQSLRLMDHSIGEREVFTIFCPNVTASDHPGQLLLDLVWEIKVCVEQLFSAFI